MAVANAQDWQGSYDLSGNFEVRAAASTNALPQILGQPQLQIVIPGELASFSVVMADARGLTYQWRFNGVPISGTGSTSDTLLLANVSATNEGPYSVVVVNSSGSVTSAPALLMLDSDEDGLPDSWEMAFFGNLTSQRSLGDPDGDGISNFDEFRAGTSPNHIGEFHPLLTVTKIGSGFGEVTIVPAKPSYDLGEIVTLSATPLAPSLFAGWSGNLNTMSNPVTLAMYSNQTVQAMFSTAVTPPPGMIALWRAETDASDTIGTNHGAFYSGASVVGPSITSTGKVGSAFDFDGTVHVQVPGTSALRPAHLTAEAWVYPTLETPVDFQVVLANNDANPYGDWWLGLYANRIPFFYTPPSISFAPLQIPLNQWTHLAVSFDGLTRRLYVNGAEAVFQGGLGPLRYNLDATSLLTIGSDWRGGPTRHFNGRIDEVALYNRVLTASEIAGLYNADLAGRILDRPYFSSAAQFPRANIGIGYMQQVVVALGAAPTSLALTAGALPPGLTFSPAGVISGVPSVAGTFDFTLRATDAAAVSTEQQCTLAVFDQVPVPPGLAGWWRAENDALDSAGANHGTLSNGVTFTTGNVGQAFAFNGVDQSVAIPDAPALRPASLTLETWVRINTTANYQVLFSKPVGSGNIESYILFLTPPAILSGRFGDAAGFGGGITGGSLATGIWHHVAYTFDDNTRQQILYKDGAQVASGTGTKSIGYDTQPLLLGRDSDFGSPYFFLNGSLDEAAIYNRALSGTEIASIYNAGPLGKRLFSTLPPIVLRPSVQDGAVVIAFDADVGRSYTVQSANALGTNTWSVLTNVTAVTTNVVFSEPIHGPPRRFYRVSTAGD